MSILINKNSRVIVQGITGSEGQFHSEQMINYGTNIVAGVTPGKGGTETLDSNIPVHNSVEDAVLNTDADTSIIFVPPPFASEAIIEAVYAGIKVVVCITIKDMVKVKNILKNHDTRLIGPNCPGIITVDECKLGIMPGFICKKGNIGVVSKSGTLTYEAIDQLVNVGLGQTTAIGIGGDPIVGTTMRDCLDLFESDQETHGVVIIGEIGGQMEVEAAKWAKNNMTKPVVGFIAGQTAPPGRRMGHAGAIISGGKGGANDKIEVMKSAGITISMSPADIGKTLFEKLNG